MSDHPAPDVATDDAALIPVVLPWFDWLALCRLLERASRGPASADLAERRRALHWVGVIHQARRDVHDPIREARQRAGVAGGRATARSRRVALEEADGD